MGTPAESDLRQLLALAPVFLLAADRGGVVLVALGQVTTAFGRSAEDLMGRPVEEILAERPALLVQVRRALAGEAFTADLELDGATWEVRHAPRRATDGALDGCLAVGVDVTSRRAVHEEARRSLAFLDAIVEHIPDMIFVKDAAHLRFVRFNRAGEELLGYSREELVGRSDHDFFPPEEAAFFVAKDRAVLEVGALVDIPEEPIHTRHLGRRILHTKKIPLMDEAGRPAYLLGISEDITERKLVEAERQRLVERLQELDRLKARLVANVSHELRTPLTLVLGTLERLLERRPEADPERADLELARRNANALLGLIQDLLDVSRLEAGALRPDYADVDLARLLRETVGLFEHAAQDRAVRLVIDAPGPVLAQVDPPKVARVLGNLLSNALKVVPAGGVVRCSLSQRDGRAALEVADSGPGIPPALRGRVFDRFFQLESGPGGAGLGLAIVRELVALHGGDVSIQDAPEGGAAFLVELPLAAPPGAEVRETEPAAPSALSPPPTGPTAQAGTTPSPLAADDDRALVLVVEDHPELRDFLTRSLERDHRVMAARDGLEGLTAARARPPDLVITDVMMPRVSGGELVAALRGNPALAEVPILVLTARADDVLRLELLRLGVNDYLMKPVTLEELRVRAARLVAVKRAGDVLRHALTSAQTDLVALARELSRRNQELDSALATARAARDAAQESARAKDALLSMVSHELRTPLTTIGLQVERLLRRPALEEFERQGLMRVAAAAARLGGLVATLLDYVRVEAGRLRVEPAPLDPLALVRDVVDELVPQAERKGLALTWQGEEGGPLESDARLLRTVVVNLVENAIKYTERGQVEVVVARDRGALRLDVRDTGVGIPEREHGRIFEPFEQVEALREKHTPGLGLGLALVRRLVRGLGGTVTLSSTPGVGSTFTVMIPAAPPVVADKLVSSARDVAAEG